MSNKSKRVASAIVVFRPDVGTAEARGNADRISPTPRSRTWNPSHENGSPSAAAVLACGVSAAFGASVVSPFRLSDSYFTDAEVRLLRSEAIARDVLYRAIPIVVAYESGCGRWIRTTDLWGMNPASYFCSIPQSAPIRSVPAFLCCLQRKIISQDASDNPRRTSPLRWEAPQLDSNQRLRDTLSTTFRTVICRAAT